MKASAFPLPRLASVTVWVVSSWVAWGPVAAAQEQEPAVAHEPADVVGTLGMLLDRPSSEAATADPNGPWKLRKKGFGKGDHSSLALDAQGRPHVSFIREGKNTSVLMHAWNDGKHWISEKLFPDLYVLGSTAIAIDGNGDPHIAFTIYDNGSGETFLEYAHKVAGVWEAETVEQGGRECSIAVDEAAAVHIVHVRTVQSVRHLELTPTGWIGEDIVPVGAQEARTSLQVRNGTAYAMFTAGPPFSIHLATKGTGDWVVQDLEEGFEGAMAIDADGVVHVVYSGYSGHPTVLRHAWLTRGGWQFETLATASTVFGEAVDDGVSVFTSWPALTVDFTGHLQLAFELTLAVDKFDVETVFLATLADGVWAPSGFGPKGTGIESSIAATPTGIVHVITGKEVGDSTSLMDLALKGAKLSLSVVPKGAGVISIDPPGTEVSTKFAQEFCPGVDVDLTEVPAEGFTFVGWFKDGTGTANATAVTMDKKRKVVAKFAPVP